MHTRMLRICVVMSTVMSTVAIAGVATAQTPGPANVSGAAPSSLRAFSIPKPPEEIVQEAPVSKLQDTLRERTRLPAQHDLLRTTVGLGHVLQRDWGVELSSSGRLRGLQANLNSFVTIGAAGVEAPSGRLSLFEPHAGWGVEVGDVLSELRGLARGARFGLSGNRRHRPSISMYVTNERLHDTSTIFGFRDEIRLFSHVAAGGEITSDKSYFVRAAYVGRRIDLQASYRRIFTDDPAADAGVMASYTFGPGVTVNAGLRTFETASDNG